MTSAACSCLNQGELAAMSRGLYSGLTEFALWRQLPNLPSGTEVWIKCDDLSGMQLSGNKVSWQVGIEFSILQTAP
jgi:hypothetical protein